MGDWNRDDGEDYIVVPWADGYFSSLAELEMAYGDNCVDGTMCEVAERWATRSGTTFPCIGAWAPKSIDLDTEARRWAAEEPRVPDEDGIYVSDFRCWLLDRLGDTAEFHDFIWDRFSEFALETATALRQNVMNACGDEIEYSPEMFDKFRDRANALPFHVRVKTPALPLDMEKRLERAVEEASHKDTCKSIRIVLGTPGSVHSKRPANPAAAMHPALAESRTEHPTCSLDSAEDGNG